MGALRAEKSAPTEPTHPEKNHIPRRVIISVSALRDIILAATEVYKKETLGYLVGIKGKEAWTILNAAPYQTAEKTFTGSAVKQDKIDLMKALAKQFHEDFCLCGDFHSHAQWGDQLRRAMPSDEDVADAEPGYLYIIIAVNDLPKEMRQKQWRISRRRMILSGTIGKYHIEVAAFYCPEFGRLVKVPLTLQGALAEPADAPRRQKGRLSAFE